MEVIIKPFYFKVPYHTNTITSKALTLSDQRVEDCVALWLYCLFLTTLVNQQMTENTQFDVKYSQIHSPTQSIYYVDYY